jgi:hypothetical protein
MSVLPDHQGVAGREALLALRLKALTQLVSYLEALLASPVIDPSGLEDLSLRHLAKAAGTTRSALVLMGEGSWSDACILVRAVFEQLFGYLWVVQDPLKADARNVMVTIKQEWANAKYLEGLAVNADSIAQEKLLEAAQAYKAIAEGLMAELAAKLGTTEKKVRDEAKMRVSAKAVEVNLGPEFSIPYAHYSGFAHSDGNALAAYGQARADGVHYSIRGAAPQGLPVASDLHRALLRLASEALQRCPRLNVAEVEATLKAHATWLDEVDAKEPWEPSADR